MFVYSTGDDWYMTVDGLHAEDVASFNAFARATGAWRSKAGDVVLDDGGVFRLHVNVPATLIPSGQEVSFYIEGVKKDSTTFRDPASGSYSALIYR